MDAKPLAGWDDLDAVTSPPVPLSCSFVAGEGGRALNEFDDCETPLSQRERGRG
jgi:hypothetical protein